MLVVRHLHDLGPLLTIKAVGSESMMHNNVDFVQLFKNIKAPKLSFVDP